MLCMIGRLIFFKYFWRLVVQVGSWCDFFKLYSYVDDDGFKWVNDDLVAVE